MGDFVKTATAGVVAIGLVTAFGLHAKGLSQFSLSAGKAGSRILNTAETGGPRQ